MGLWSQPDCGTDKEGYRLFANLQWIFSDYSATVRPSKCWVNEVFLVITLRLKEVQNRGVNNVELRGYLQLPTATPTGKSPQAGIR
jgi:hypothetical protein